MRILLKKILPLFLVSSGLIASAMAQSGAPDPAFETGELNGVVGSILKEPNGNLIISGGFSGLQGTNRNGVARLKPGGLLDGSFDPAATFGSTFYGSPTARFSNGSILLARPYVDAAQGYLIVNKLYRYTAAGVNEPGFSSFPGANGAIDDFIILPNDDILIWGGFSQVEGFARRGLARLSPSGHLNQSFNPQLAEGAWVLKAQYLTDGTVVVYASLPSSEFKIFKFSSTGVLIQQIPVQLTCSTAGLIPFITDLIVQPNGKFLLSGRFNAVDGTVRNGIARLNADGSVDASFNSDFLRPETVVNDLILQASGRIVLAGKIYRSLSSDSVSVLRLFSDGSHDRSFDTEPEGGGYSSYSGLALSELTDGKLLVSLYSPGSSNGGGAGGGVVIIGGGGTNPSDPYTPPSYKLVRLFGDGSYPPHRPISVIIDSKAPNLTRVSWKDVADETGYEIERWANNSWVAIGSVSANVTHFDDTAVEGVINYLYRVRARNANGNSLYSNADAASIPSAFSSFTAVANAANQVDLSWSTIPGIWRYDIYRTLTGADPGPILGVSPGERGLGGSLGGGSLGGGTPPSILSNAVLIGSVSSDRTSFSDRSMQPRKFYIYQVSAVNVAGRVNTSGKTISVPTDQAPSDISGLTVTPSANQSVVLAWRDVNWENGYVVERSVNGTTGWQAIATLASDVNRYLDSQGFPEGLTFYYRVRAFNGMGFSNPSAVAAVTASSATLMPAGSPDMTYSGRTWISNFKPSLSGYGYGINTSSVPPSLLRMSATGQTIYSFYSTLRDFSTVTDYLVMPNEKVWVAGLPGPSSMPKLIPIDSRGENDYQTLFPSFDKPVLRLLALSSGKVLALGSFKMVEGNASTGVARLNSSGTLDTAFLMSGLPLDKGTPNNVIEQSDGKLVVCFGGSTLVRLFPDGARDLGFGTSGQVGVAGGKMLTMALQSSDKVLIGGSFQTVDCGGGATLVGSFARLTKDGLLDQSFLIGDGFPQYLSYGLSILMLSQSVQSIVVDSFQRILVSGNISKYDTNPVKGVIRLLPDGTLDPNFQYSDAGFDNPVVSLGLNDTFYLNDVSGYSLRRFYNKPTLNPNTPPPPAGSPASDSAVTLAWENQGAVSFDVEQWDSATSSWSTLASGITSTNYVVQNLNPGTPLNFRVRRNFSSGPSSYTPSILAKTFTSFENWKNVRGFDSQQSGTADPDRDGIPALMEYALDLNPAQPDRSGVPRVESDPTHIKLTFKRKRSELNYIVETSTDLKAWTASGVAEITNADTGEVTAQVSTESDKTRYIRLRVAE